MSTTRQQPFSRLSAWPRWTPVLMAAVLVGVMLALAPFVVALGVHHALAEADHDGHQHSDFDLCQWVQLHTHGSLTAQPPAVQAFLSPKFFQLPEAVDLVSVGLVRTGRPRAPPLS